MVNGKNFSYYDKLIRGTTLRLILNNVLESGDFIYNKLDVEYMQRFRPELKIFNLARVDLS